MSSFDGTTNPGVNPQRPTSGHTPDRPLSGSVPNPPTNPGSGTHYSALKIIGMVISILIGLGVISAGVVTFSARLAEGDFLTITAAKQREAELMEKVEIRISNSESLAAERERRLTEKIEDLKKSQLEANHRVEAQIDRVLDILLQK